MGETGRHPVILLLRAAWNLWCKASGIASATFLLVYVFVTVGDGILVTKAYVAWVLTAEYLYNMGILK